MRRAWSTTLATSLLALGIAGCSDFLSGEDVTRDPNLPATATRDALFVGIQPGQFGVQEASLAEITCEFVQACTGIQRFSQERGQYGFTDVDFNADWAQLYGGGGLLEIRQVQASATQDGEIVYRGIAKVWEAFIVGTLASIWGDVPFREATTPGIEAPVLDDQLFIYDTLQVLLDGAIADLQTGIELAAPVGDNDLVYGGDATLWTGAAYTLKARYYMHTAELRGLPAYQAAFAAAQQGISSPANNFTAFHSATNLEQNLWWQFNANSGFGADLVAGRFLADLMVARNDPRLPQYFGDADGDPDNGAQYGGASPQGDESPVGVSPLEGTRNVPSFRQPLITYEENQLILAEAAFQSGGGAGAAQPFVDAVRATVGLPPDPVAGLNDIMEEKYIALFQNIETFNDYKRTCYPTVDPFPNPTYTFGGVNRVPGRLYYAQGEENVNPNVPDVATQISTYGAGQSRNDNDPTPCPDPVP